MFLSKEFSIFFFKLIEYSLKFLQLKLYLQAQIRDIEF